MATTRWPRPLPTMTASQPAHADLSRYTHLHVCDADAHASSLASWNQHYEQLSSGPYEGTLEDLRTGPVQLFLEQATQATLQSGQPRENTCTVGVFQTLDSHAGWYCGQRLHGEHLVVMPPGSPFTLKTGLGMRLSALCIDLPHLNRMGQHWHGSAQPLHLPNTAAVLDAPAADTTALRELLACSLALARAQPQWLQQPAAQRMLTVSLTDAMLQALSAAVVAQPADLPGRSATRRDIVDRARAYMRDHAEEALSVPDLCAAVRVSRRALQYAFEDVLQLSPVTYLRLMRLNRVRQVLLTEPGTPVADAAARWGFWHPSRFAADYRGLFGELPSATRARHAPVPAHRARTMPQ
jgi:AraC family ethanolamine operon transcriptional activator